MRTSDTAKMMRAVGLVIARQAQALAEAETAAANDVIGLAPALRVWREGPYKTGAVVSHEGVPYRCAQAHDSTDNALWSPDKAPALWAPYHATDAGHALPYQAPTGAQDAYRAGEWMVWTDGGRYRCASDSTVWGPDNRPQDWRKEG